MTTLDTLAELRALFARLGSPFPLDKPKPRKPRCGARRKTDGEPCEARALENGRCRHHGGLSTGPKTPEGRAQALANLRQNRAS
jgi:hypothetical protein